jgi:hypothetical protein
MAKFAVRTVARTGQSQELFQVRKEPKRPPQMQMEGCKSCRIKSGKTGDLTEEEKSDGSKR